MSYPLCSLERHWSDVTTGWLIVFGNIVTVLPQLVILLRTGSNTGLNLWTVLLSCVSTGTTLFNGFDDFWNDFYCCTVTSLGACNNLLVVWYGLATWFLGWHAIYIVSLLAWPPVDTEKERLKQIKQKWIHTGVFFVYMITFCGCVILVVMTNVHYHHASTFFFTIDSIWGITSAITTAAIWIPQVYTTYTMKDAGSLSMSLVALAALGTGITVYNQIQYRATYWVWVPQLIAGFFCVILMVMGGWYAYRNKRTFREFLFPTHIEEVYDPDVEIIN